MSAAPLPIPNEAVQATPVTASAKPVASRAVRIREIVLLWFFWSLVTATWHVNKMTIKQYFLHRFTWAPRDLVWMSPVGNLIMIGVPTAILILLTLVSPRLVPRWLAAFIPAFLAAIGMILIVPGLENYAIWVLALGVGAQCARVIGGASGDRWLPRLKFVSVALSAIFLVAGTASRVWRNTAEWRWARGAPAAVADAPNVLILLLDTVRAQSLGLYGYTRPTSPSIDSLVPQSTVFNQAFATAGWTLPSHCSFFTGRYPANHSCRWEIALDGTPRTMAEVFRDHGYRTAGFAANLFYTTHETGLARGFNRWEDFKVSLKQILCSSTLAQAALVRTTVWDTSSTERYKALRLFLLKGDPKPEVDRRSAREVASPFIDWLGTGSQRPFFAYLNFFDAHEPYEPAEGYGAHFVKQKPTEQDRYDGGIAFMDNQVGRILGELRRRGILDKTLVVVMGDHGEQFGEHKLQTHGNSLYIQLLHVPLVMRLPGKIPEGVRVNRAVTLRDLPRTLLDVAGIKDTKGIFGTSLVAAISDSSHETSAIIAETEQTAKWNGVPTHFAPMSSAIDQQFQYIKGYKGQEWLFDFRADPQEERDLVADAAYGVVMGRMRAELTNHGKTPKTSATGGQ
ncbi:MAG: sulfatase [Gemmatimonadaceae bacterium]